MSGWMFVPAAVAQLATGSFFKRYFHVLLRALAVVSALGGLVSVFGMLYAMGRAVEYAGGVGKAGVVLAFIVFAATMAALVYVVVHLLILRSNTVAQLPDSEFVVIPILVVLLRLAGEILSAVIVAISFVTFLAMLFAGDAAGFLLDRFDALSFGSRGAGFVGGAISLVSGCLVATLVLLVGYYLSESLAVFVRIAEHTKAIADAANRDESTSTE